MIFRRACAACAGAPARDLGVGDGFREKLEAQSARNGSRLDQADRNAVTEPVAFAAAVANERVAVFVVAKIFRAHRARGNEAVGTGIVKLHE